MALGYMSLLKVESALSCLVISSNQQRGIWLLLRPSHSSYSSSLPRMENETRENSQPQDGYLGIKGDTHVPLHPEPVALQ